MSGARRALIVALGLLAVALAAVLSGSPPSVTRSPLPLAELAELGNVSGPTRLCQSGEVLPAGTTAVRLSLETLIGPPVALTASAGGRVLTSGRRAAGWSSGSVTIPVAPLARAHARVTICARVSRPREQLNVDGVAGPPGTAVHEAHGNALEGRMFVEYLRPGTSSWLSRARSVARRMGLGHALDGGWIAILAAALMATVAALLSWLVVRELA
jgi:hypothetical protein